MKNQDLVVGNMPKVLDADFSQTLMFPPCVEDWINETHPAKFVRDFVEQLKLSEVGVAEITGAQEPGRPAYSPRLLLRAWIYGYYFGFRSCRKLEQACRTDLGLVWLTGNLQPDHNSLWRFWKQHRQCLSKVYRVSVRLAIEERLVDLEVLALDGTKIQAACGRTGAAGKKDLGDKLAMIEERIKELEEQIAAQGQANEESQQSQAHQKQLYNSKEMRGKIRKALDEIQAGKTQYCHPQESEARRMNADGRNRFSYNAQAVVDKQKGIMVAADVCSRENDLHELEPMIEQVQANTGKAPAAVVADGGYSSGEQIAKAQARGQTIAMPMPGGTAKSKEATVFHTSEFSYDKEKDVVICPAKREIRYFRTRTDRQQPIRVYRHRAACKDCPLQSQCTGDRHGRSIEIRPETYEAVEKHREWMASNEAKELYKTRASLIERVFGWIKQAHGFRRWTLKGLEKVKAQWAMITLVWNLRILYSSWAAKRLQTDDAAAV